eukprot:jgi/Psemu1/60470/gm1.60470_g
MSPHSHQQPFITHSLLQDDSRQTSDTASHSAQPPCTTLTHYNRATQVQHKPNQEPTRISPPRQLQLATT